MGWDMQDIEALIEEYSKYSKEETLSKNLPVPTYFSWN
jgi:hypothetical protein